MLMIFGVAVIVSFIFTFFSLIRFSMRASKYFNKSDPDYYKVSIGNPLNALFNTELLTKDGIKQRAFIGKVLSAIWLIYFLSVVVVSIVNSIF